jgi:hypothetical protein
MGRLALLAAMVVFVLIAISPAASAASLAIVQGPVYVNHGNGFQPASGYVDVFPGDTIMAQPNSVSRITYSDNCVQAIQAGSTVAISEVSPCAAQSSNWMTTSSTTPTSEMNYFPYVVGVAAIGGAVAAIAASGGGGGSHHPASP